MSVVACKIIEAGFEIAADSICVRGGTQTKGENVSVSKLFYDGDIVIGSVGPAEGGALMELFLKTHKPADATEGSLLEFMSEFYDWKRKKTDDGKIENHFLVGICGGGGVFGVYGWLIRKVMKFEAIGAGMDFALAALSLGHSAEEAVGVACDLSAWCEKPIRVLRR